MCQVRSLVPNDAPVAFCAPLYAGLWTVCRSPILGHNRTSLLPEAPRDLRNLPRQRDEFLVKSDGLPTDQLCSNWFPFRGNPLVSASRFTTTMPNQFPVFEVVCVPKIRFGVDAASGRRKLAS